MRKTAADSTDSADSADSGVSRGAELLAYTDAVMNADAEAIERTRETLAAALGSEGVTESAAVIAMFNVVDRVADATGIPIDVGFTRDLRYEIGDELGMSHLTPEERASH